MERRRFMKASLTGVVGLAAACSSGTSPAGGPVTGTAAAGGTAAPTSPASAAPAATGRASPQPSDWAALAKGLSGSLVLPGQAAYDTARLLFNPRFDDARPAGVAYCAAPADVVECLAFARRFGVPLAVRSGGHSNGGWSVGPGLVLDVTRMNAVQADAASGTATVGAGTRLVDVYSALASSGVTVPAGSCPTVGIAGLALGGGIGVTGRAYGLTCDAVVSVDVVTADGRALTCDANHESDLYWACRGGGGGNFAVATGFRLRTYAAPTVAVFFLSWPWAQAVPMADAWQRWAPGLPDEIWSNCHLLANPSGAVPTATVGGVVLGSASDLTPHLDALTAAVGSQPSSQSVRAHAYMDAMLLLAGCSGLTATQCHLPSQAPGGTLQREADTSKSDLFSAPIPTATLTGLVRSVEARRALGDGDGGVAFDALGGAVNRVAPDATAFVHRTSLFDAQYTNHWVTGASSATMNRQLAWLRSLYAIGHPAANGEAYQNYADPELTGWQQAYYGANLARLKSVKAAYDPTGLFSFPQAVPGR